MSQTFANTINNNPIYADRAEKDAAGNTISTTYATKSEIPTVELFEAVYGTTTYADITAAITAKKIVYCRISPNGASRMAFLAYIGANNVEFQYYRSLSSHSASSQLDEVYVYTVDANGWTTTTRKAGVSIAAGTGLTSSYASGTLTINGKDTDQTYDATSANPQSGVAVAGALAGKEDSFAVGAGLTMDTSGTTRTLRLCDLSTTEELIGSINGVAVYRTRLTGTFNRSTTFSTIAIASTSFTVTRAWLDGTYTNIAYDSSEKTRLGIAYFLAADRYGSLYVERRSDNTATVYWRGVDTGTGTSTAYISLMYTKT